MFAAAIEGVRIMPPSTDCDDRASYEKFGEFVRDYSRGEIGPYKTTDLARRCRVAMSTAYRWALILQRLFDLRLDRDGYWVRRSKTCS